MLITIEITWKTIEIHEKTSKKGQIYPFFSIFHVYFSIKVLFWLYIEIFTGHLQTIFIIFIGFIQKYRFFKHFLAIFKHFLAIFHVFYKFFYINSDIFPFFNGKIPSSYASAASTSTTTQLTYSIYGTAEWNERQEPPSADLHFA